MKDADHALRISKAFNAGCDARLRGDPLSDNPFFEFESRVEAIKAEYWRMGWMDVHTFWGRDSQYLVKPLPSVDQKESA